MTNPRLCRELVLDDATSADLGSQLALLNYPQSNFALWLRQVRRTVFNVLPDPIHEEFDSFVRDPDWPVVLHLRNGPTDPEPGPTPSNGKRAPNKPTSVSEGWVAGLAGQFGRVFAMAKEKGFEVVNDITPTRAAARTKTNAGSEVPLDLHTELAALCHNPDWLILGCVRRDSAGKAATLLLDGRRLFEKLLPRQRWLLQQEVFCFQTPESMGCPEYTPPRPVFFVEQNRLVSLRLALYGMFGVTKDAEAVLTEVRRLAADLAEPLVLSPGEALIIDNRVAAHGRAPWDATFSDQERWLQRALAASRVRDFPLEPNGSRFILG